MQQLNLILRNIFIVIISITWIAGIVLAKGFWLTLLSICMPFYAWYLIIEKIMVDTGFIL